MKKLLIFALILSLTGCKSENKGNYTPKEETSENDTTNDTKETIAKNEYGYMNENELGTYEIIFNGEKTFTVNDNYLIDMLALEFDEELMIDTTDYTTPHLSGEFRYSYGGKDYVTKLNEINIGFFYTADSGRDFFQIDVEGNQIRYWLYSKGKAELVINKIWRFVPNE